MGVGCHLGCLTCCGVHVFLGQGSIVFSIGALMIEQVDTLNQFVQMGQITGIAAVGITAGL